MHLPAGIELIETTADMGMRVKAASKEELFALAGTGLFGIITDLRQIKLRDMITICIEEEALDLLFVQWLNRLLYLFDGEGMLLSEIACSFQGHRLEAVCRGESYEVGRHHLRQEIKAVTYHRLRLEQLGTSWEAEVILDV
jgi:SHS2 domain-containing protein